MNSQKVQIAKTKLQEEVVKRNHILLTPYLSAHAPIKIKCEKGHTFNTTPNRYRKGFGCSWCSGRNPGQSKTTFLNQISTRNHILLSPYIDNSEKVTIQCPFGHVFKQAPVKFKSGQGCRVCANTDTVASFNRLEEKVISQGDTIVGEYISNQKPLAMLCREGHLFDIRPNDYKEGHRCSICAGKNQKQLYLHLIIDEGTVVAVKFGIAVNSEARLKQQRLRTKFKIAPFKIFYFENSVHCKEAERLIKQSVPTSVLTKFDFKDGYTETVAVSSVDYILCLIELCGGVPTLILK